jgi:hypothetical protein
MGNSTDTASRLWLSLVIGLAVACGLLLAVRPTTVAAPMKVQPADDFVLWLTPPETSPASELWPLAAEAHQAGWQARSTVVEERLATLRNQERIVAFEPLAGGVGFTITAPVGLPPEVRRWREVSRVTPPGEATPEALDAWWRQGLNVAAVVRPTPLASQQVTTLTLNLGLHSRMVSGSTPRPEPIALSLTRDGELIASSTAMPFPSGSGGYLYAATLFEVYVYGGGGGGGGYCYPAIEPDDVLLAVQAGQTHSLTVPLLTALADQNTVMVYGQTAPSATLSVYLYRYDDTSVVYQQTVTATTTGGYQADFGGLAPLAPRDYGYVFHVSGGGNHVYARYNVPFLRVGFESDYLQGVVAPCAVITATLREPSGAPRDLAYGFSSSNGAFSVYFSTPSQVGDTLVVTAAGQVVSMTIPTLTAHPDAANDVVFGEALPGAAVEVDLYRGPLGYSYPSCPPYGDPDYSLSVTSALTGTLMGVYAADFSGLAGVIAGDYGAVYLTDAAGFQVYRCFAVPFMRAHLGDYYLTGQVNGSGPLTVTVWGSSGIPRDVHWIQAYGSGYFYDDDWEGELRLLAGDRVTVTTRDGEETGITMPWLTANADRANSIVYGQAPPNSSLRVGLSAVGLGLAGGGPPYDPYYDYTLWVTSTASGVYTADFSSLTTMQPGDQGAVFYVDPQDYEAYLEFSVLAAPAVRVQSGGNYVGGALPVESGQVVVTLRDALGRVKATASTWAYDWGSFDVHLYRDGQPVIIKAGDTVEVTAGDTRIQTPTPTSYPTSHAVENAAEDIFIVVAVPTLTVQADRVADVLSGQAPPDAPVEVTWRGGDDWDEAGRTWIVTATAAGDYELDLGAQVDLDRGDQIEVAWTDENGNQVWVAYRVSRIDAALRRNSVYVFGPAYRPLTLTLLSASHALLYTGTDTFNASGRARFGLYDQSGAPLYLGTGQTLVADLADEVMTATLPHLTARVDPQADTVSGEAPPRARLMISFGYYDWNYWPVTATVAGTYSLDLSDIVGGGSIGNGEVVYLHPDGHRVTLNYFAPHIEVALGQPYVNGVAPGPGVVTVTLRDAGGNVKGSGADTSWCGGWFYVSLADAQQEPAPVSGGDEVVVEAAGSVMAFSVPTLTASFDRQTGILTGAAPAGVWLSVVLAGGSRRIQAGADGTYAMDWGDLSPSPGAQGYVRITDGLGNETRLYFAVPYYDLYLPLASRGE